MSIVFRLNSSFCGHRACHENKKSRLVTIKSPGLLTLHRDMGIKKFFPRTFRARRQPTLSLSRWRPREWWAWCQTGEEMLGLKEADATRIQPGVVTKGWCQIVEAFRSCWKSGSLFAKFFIFIGSVCVLFDSVFVFLQRCVSPTECARGLDPAPGALVYNWCYCTPTRSRAPGKSARARGRGTLPSLDLNIMLLF